MKTPVFRGSAVAIVTPMTENGVDFDALGRLIEFQIAGGTDGVVVCGTTGEAPTLSDEEHHKCIEYCVEKVAGRVPVIAGTGSNDTQHALEMSKFAKSAGVDALLMVTPYYNRTTQRGLVKHYLYIADRVDLPIILYDVPSRTTMKFTAESYAELSKHPNINGIKEASGDMALVAHTRYLCGDEMNIWSGEDNNTVQIMAMGGQGVVSTAANIVPGVMRNITRKMFGGDTAGAAKLQIEYFDLINALFCETNPIPVKTALNIMGKDAGILRLPLCEMSEDHLEYLKTAMRNHGLIKM